MDRDGLKRTLVKVLDHIQTTGHHPVPSLKGSTCPLEDLEGFDSQMAVVATGLLSAELGVPIPNDLNIFQAKKGNKRLTIDEIVEVVEGLGSDGNPGATSRANTSR